MTKTEPTSEITVPNDSLSSDFNPPCRQPGPTDIGRKEPGGGTIGRLFFALPD